MTKYFFGRRPESRNTEKSPDHTFSHPPKSRDAGTAFASSVGRSSAPDISLDTQFLASLDQTQNENLLWFVVGRCSSGHRDLVPTQHRFLVHARGSVPLWWSHLFPIFPLRHAKRLRVRRPTDRLHFHKIRSARFHHRVSVVGKEFSRLAQESASLRGSATMQLELAKIVQTTQVPHLTTTIPISLRLVASCFADFFFQSPALEKPPQKYPCSPKSSTRRMARTKQTALKGDGAPRKVASRQAFGTKKVKPLRKILRDNFHGLSGPFLIFYCPQAKDIDRNEFIQAFEEMVRTNWKRTLISLYESQDAAYFMDVYDVKKFMSRLDKLIPVLTCKRIFIELVQNDFQVVRLSAQLKDALQDIMNFVIISELENFCAHPQSPAHLGQKQHRKNVHKISEGNETTQMARKERRSRSQSPKRGRSKSPKRKSPKKKKSKSPRRSPSRSPSGSPGRLTGTNPMQRTSKTPFAKVSKIVKSTTHYTTKTGKAATRTTYMAHGKGAGGEALYRSLKADQAPAIAKKYGIKVTSSAPKTKGQRKKRRSRSGSPKRKKKSCAEIGKGYEDRCNARRNK
jgi:hypothetical protein